MRFASNDLFIIRDATNQVPNRSWYQASSSWYSMCSHFFCILSSKSAHLSVIIWNSGSSKVLVEGPFLGPLSVSFAAKLLALLLSCVWGVAPPRWVTAGNRHKRTKTHVTKSLENAVVLFPLRGECEDFRFAKSPFKEDFLAKVLYKFVLLHMVN